MALLKKSGVLWKEGKRVKSGLLFAEGGGRRDKSTEYQYK